MTDQPQFWDLATRVILGSFVLLISACALWLAVTLIKLARDRWSGETDQQRADRALAQLKADMHARRRLNLASRFPPDQKFDAHDLHDFVSRVDRQRSPRTPPVPRRNTGL